MANFNYSKPFPPQVPNSGAVFQRSFKHRPWTDGQDVDAGVRDAPRRKASIRACCKIEADFDALASDSTRAFALIADMRQTLAQLLIEIRDQLNTKTDKTKEGKERARRRKIPKR